MDQSMKTYQHLNGRNMEQDQKDFIRSKVTELGSVQAGKEFYNKDCKVDQLALVYAHTIFNKPKKFSSKK